MIYLSLLVAVLGLLAYGFAGNPKISEVGRMSYFAGLLVFLLRFGQSAISALR